MKITARELLAALNEYAAKNSTPAYTAVYGRGLTLNDGRVEVYETLLKPEDTLINSETLAFDRANGRHGSRFI